MMVDMNIQIETTTQRNGIGWNLKQIMQTTRLILTVSQFVKALTGAQLIRIIAFSQLRNLDKIVIRPTTTIMR